MRKMREKIQREKMKIRYKVVTYGRESCVVAHGSMYCLKYKKGTIVKAVPGTFGIMVFSTKRRANEFRQGYQILKVRAIGRRRKIYRFSQFSRDQAKDTTILFKKFYKIYHSKKRRKCWWTFFRNFKIIPVPLGTECYPAVEVLE
jgi:hypothetical protein